MDAEDIADIVNTYIVQTELAKAFSQPCGTRSFSKRRRSNARHLELPVGELRLLRAKPVEGGAQLRRGGDPRNFFVHRGMGVRHFSAGTERHGSDASSYNVK